MRAEEIEASSSGQVRARVVIVGAAGAVEAIATVLALNARVAPPTLNYEVPDEGLDLDYVPDGPRPLAVNGNGNGSRPPVALSNSFGFGGHNAVLVIQGLPTPAS